MDLDTNIRELKGIGEKTAALFARLQLFTVGDLIRYFPRTYETYEAPVPVREAVGGEIQAFRCRILAAPSLKKIRNLTILQFHAADETGKIILTFFNMPFLKNTLKPGDSYIFRGIFRDGKLEQPRFFKEEEYKILQKEIQPAYPLTKGITNHTVKKAVKQALSNISLPNDPLPLWIREQYHLTGYEEAVCTMHFPPTEEALVHARRRLVFEEFFLFLLLVRRNKTLIRQEPSPYTMIETAETTRLVQALPYRLTAGQTEALKEITQDMTSGCVMSRMIQGDVGSGKTILAVLALLLCVSNGYQGAFMAPTEVLALQHFKLIEEMTRDYGLPFQPVLLTGSIRAKEKRAAYEEISNGVRNLVIGTHALLEDDVIFQNLGLVVADEQHRFGVKQRTILTKKGEDVHTIVMSATPIPRSLAMILYGGLSISTIPELPSNRIPIKNAVVDTRYRPTAYKFMKDEIAKGRQIYIICPMVESGMMEELENVEDYSQKLKETFDESVRIGTLHGKMKGAEKNRIMEEFSAGNYDILVSTTVIEVGINVPNATVMMVENAERFGLAALHQLRGRVGRGSHQSYCIFVDTTGNGKSKKRLEILGKTNDGFEIADADLKMRGPGEMSGTLQSGDTGFIYADIYEDADMLYLASQDVEEILREDSDLTKPEHKTLRTKWQDVLENGYLHTI